MGLWRQFFWFPHKQEEERVPSALEGGPGTFVLKLSFPRGTELLHAVGALSLVFPVRSGGPEGVKTSGSGVAGEGEAGRSEGWGYDLDAGEVWMERVDSFLLERPC